MSVTHMSEVEKNIHGELEELQETQEELVEAQKKNIWSGGWARTIGLASIVSIALGGFNDSVDAIEKMADFGLSQLTDIPSHKKLNKIYIRSSSEVLDQTFGAPVYIKRSSEGDVIKYYQDENFVISAISRDNAIVAYLVFPSEGFLPETIEHAGGVSFFDEYFEAIESVSDARASYARTGNYYIEENNGGEFGFLYSSISGVSEFTSPMDSTSRQLLSSVADAFMLDENITESIQALRSKVKPNFFGYSTLGINSLEDGILSNTEYRLINKR
ncbi:putative orphan protein [Vibrio ishigakensis]|uniref:Putative orphan protein n=1 Tax=Vibrio ishigakensis TaxID=1481914 RepID=A0A0B8P2A2_9VIBR|nr:ETEC_3214 domain-containing protein [Vibrio ishigakensis]GAM58727.1 putative orphan protein [Vibrio ishigakensis]